MSTVSFRSNDANSGNNQTYNEIIKEAKGSEDMQGDGKVETMSANLVGNDHKFVDPVLPPRNAVHGTFTFLS